MELRVVTWNLYHGRAVPPAGRSLLAEFAATLAGWGWEIALLQEVPPWWGPELARVAGARCAVARTARGSLPRLRRAAAERWPDLMRSGAGSANAILARGAVGPIQEHRVAELRGGRDRRLVNAVRLGADLWAANLHATVRGEGRARADVARAGRVAAAWAGAAPLVLGGDLNIGDPDAQLPGLAPAAGRGVDHVFVRGLAVGAAPEAPARRTLSDHPAVIATVCLG